MKYAVLLAAVFLSGCATIIAEPVDATHVMQTSTVTWAAVDNADEHCRKLGSRAPRSHTVYGCAIVNPQSNECFIVTNKNTTSSIIGHEILHCFYGRFHD